jgi:hypothetical protein
LRGGGGGGLLDIDDELGICHSDSADAQTSASIETREVMNPALDSIEHRFNGDAVEPWESFPKGVFANHPRHLRFSHSMKTQTQPTKAPAASKAVNSGLFLKPYVEEVKWLEVYVTVPQRWIENLEQQTDFEKRELGNRLWTYTEQAANEIWNFENVYKRPLVITKGPLGKIREEADFFATMNGTRLIKIRFWMLEWAWERVELVASKVGVPARGIVRAFLSAINQEVIQKRTMAKLRR